MTDTWETTVRTAATTMLRYPDKISDGLEAELYALLENSTPRKRSNLRARVRRHDRRDADGQGLGRLTAPARSGPYGPVA